MTTKAKKNTRFREDDLSSKDSYVLKNLLFLIQIYCILVNDAKYIRIEKIFINLWIVFYTNL